MPLGLHVVILVKCAGLFTQEVFSFQRSACSFSLMAEGCLLIAAAVQAREGRRQG